MFIYILIFVVLCTVYTLQSLHGTRRARKYWQELNDDLDAARATPNQRHAARLFAYFEHFITPALFLVSIPLTSTVFSLFEPKGGNMLFFLITIFASLLLPSIFLIFARTLYLKPNARLFVNLMAMTFMISSVYFIYV
ncbi:MAG: hypothetical protein AB1717_06145 [Pseudomonadota bacterium]